MRELLSSILEACPYNVALHGSIVAMAVGIIIMLYLTCRTMGMGASAAADGTIEVAEEPEIETKEKVEEQERIEEQQVEDQERTRVELKTIEREQSNEGTEEESTLYAEGNYMYMVMAFHLGIQ